MLERFFKKYRQVLEKEVCHKKVSYPIRHLRSLPTQVPTIAHGDHMRGQLIVKKEMRINGHFTGELSSHGKVIVGPHGFVRGNVSLDTIDVYGRVRGNISVNNLHLRRSAYVDGNITAKSITIEEGAQVTGSINLVQVSSPLLTSSAS